jgi:L-fuconolactonase
VTPFVAGVVGWIDFEDRTHMAHLRRLARHPKFLGVRPMIQNIPEDEWMFRSDIQWAFETVAELDLALDALGFPRHLANFLKLLKRYPDMRVVLDHCMKPQIRDRESDPGHFRFWADGMSRLAGETRACCKLSGIITETGGGWDTDVLRPYAAHVLTAFGSDRVMWGSDWPVSRLEAEYEEWHRVARILTGDLGEAAAKRVFGETAIEFYRLT